MRPRGRPRVAAYSWAPRRRSSARPVLEAIDELQPLEGLVIEALLLSTSPASSPIRWTVSKPRSVGSGCLLRPRDPESPGGVEARGERGEPIEVPLLGHEHEGDVHPGAGPSEPLDAGRAGSRGRCRSLGRGGDVHLRALPDAELLRQRRSGVVLVRLGHRPIVGGGRTIPRRWPETIWPETIRPEMVGRHERHPLPRRHADREPRRPLRPCAGDARRGDGRRGGGHAADRRLLRSLDIRTPLVSMFEGNEDERAAELVERLDAGDDVAVVTDGGMPSVSDPGTASSGAPWNVVSRFAPCPARRRRSPPSSCRDPDGPVRVRGIPPAAPRRSWPPPARPAARPADGRVLRISRRVRALLREIDAALGDRRVAGAGR